VFNTQGTLKTKLPGGLYTGQVPEGVALPFAVIMPGDTEVTWQSGQSYLEAVSLDLMVFAQTAATAEDAALALNKAFQFVLLTFNDTVAAYGTKPVVGGLDALGNQAGAVYRTGYRPEAELLRAPNGEIVYGVTSSYRIHVRRLK
jgi:hypothetical protein